MTLTSVFDADDVFFWYQQNSYDRFKKSTSLQSPSIHPRLIVAFLLFHPNLCFLFTLTVSHIQGFFIRHIINDTGYNQKWNVNDIQDDCHAFWNSLTHTHTHTHTHTQHWLVNPVKDSDRLLASDCVSVARVSDQNEDRGQKVTLKSKSVQLYAHYMHSLRLQRFCKLSLFKSVLENLSLCWRGYEEITCFFRCMFRDFSSLANHRFGKVKEDMLSVTQWFQILKCCFIVYCDWFESV